MAYEPVDVVEVRCWGERVGALALDPGSGYYAFEFDPSWARQRIELAPLTAPLSRAPGAFVFPALREETFSRLPAFLADSLPDDFGNALTTAYLTAEGVPADAITPLDRLAYLGPRGMGALEFRPLRGPRTRKATAVELAELVSAARLAVSGHVNTEREITGALAQLIAVGTSAGGARAKAVVALNPETGELRSGQLPADPGFEHWLLKLDGVGRDMELGTPGNYGRIEYAYHLMAVAAGVRMQPCRLMEEGGRAHFMARRFDRDGDTKIHVQTLCAMAHLDFRLIGAHDYAQLFDTANRLGLGLDDRQEAFRRMVFNVAAANCDDHTKNVSFVLREGENWELSPAYDITHAHSLSSRWTRQHLMAVNGRTTGITAADLREVGDRFGVPDMSNTIDRVLDAVAHWPSYAAEAGVPDEVTAAIGEHVAAWSAPLRPSVK